MEKAECSYILKYLLFLTSNKTIPVRIQLQPSVLHPDPETAKASYSLQNVGSVFHGQEERGHRMGNKTRHAFFFQIMIIMFHNN